MILLVLLLLPAIYLSIDSEVNLSERYLKFSLQNPVKKFKEVKEDLKQESPSKEGNASQPHAPPKTKLTLKKHFERLHRDIDIDFSAYSWTTAKKWEKVFSEFGI